MSGVTPSYSCSTPRFCWITAASSAGKHRATRAHTGSTQPRSATPARDHSAAPRARALRHLANITAIKDGGCRSVDHGSILKHTYIVLGADRSRSKLTHKSQCNTGILRRPHNYLCFVHVCTQLGCYRSTLDRPTSAQIGVEWNPAHTPAPQR